MLMKSVHTARPKASRRRDTRLARMALIVVAGVSVSGCAMQLGSMFGSSSSESTTASISNRVLPAGQDSLAMAANDMAPAASATAGSAGACPRVSIWKNDARLTVYETGRIGDSLAIRHRGEITKTARECEIAPGLVTVKYGVAGRVILGPQGRAGVVKLPVLVHVVDRSKQKIQTSKVTVKVTMVEGKPFGNFSSVQSVSFPIEPGVAASQYVVFVTFDKSSPSAG